CALDSNHRYTLDFGTKQILHAEPIANHTRKIAGYAFSNPLNQAALCFDTIARWVQSGIDAEDIIVVLPDESFKDTLKLFDTHRNLNFAMGQSQRELPTYQTLQALLDFLCAPSESEPLEIPTTWQHASAIDATGIDALAALAVILGEDAELVKLLEEFCVFYAQIAPLLAARSLAEMLKLVLLELDSRRVDDVGGGKVRVMGILETRGVAFKAVIVLNMNEGLVPRPNDKELFLNTAIRKAAHLPTHKDRENLQKHYYYALLRASEHAVLAWIENDEHNESSLVLEQEIGDVFCIERLDGEALYKHSLFGTSREIVQEPERLTLTLPSDFRLSFSKIQSFVQCPNQFYYRYIEQLEAEDSGNAELGLLAHRALAHAYKTQKTPKERERVFYETLAKAPLAGTQRFDSNVVGHYLRAFFASEQNRYDSGARTHAIEQRFYVTLDGFGIEGVIDRIDIEKDGSLHIIDYKLKKLVSHKAEDSMQLALYAQALKNRGAAEILTSFYDLYQNRLFAVDCTQGAALLAQTLQKLKGTIEIAPKINPACRYCAYKAICGLWR
ncbi:MAG: PD-(D/E)XK nuclease family protein, partial [Helicobacter sp.]|nr:PD-(D/E)XK nuclease family protein [Helicobacter sp.]